MGSIANPTLYEGRGLLSFKVKIARFVAIFILIILGLLLMFAPKLSRARRSGSAEYGLVVSRDVFGFENRWMPRR